MRLSLLWLLSHSDFSDTKNNINYTSGGLNQVDECPIKCAQLTQVFTEHGKR